MVISYKIIRSSRRKKTTTITINPDKKITVRVPKDFDEAVVQKLIEDKGEWIKKKLREIDRGPKPIKKEFVNGEKFLYFGRLYQLKVKKSKLIIDPRLNFTQGQFEAVIPEHFTDNQRERKLRGLFFDWYIKTGIRKVEKKAEFIARKLNVKFNKIKLKKVSSRWGSCSAKGNLNLNWKLVMAPHAVVNYVLIHEMCHLLHPNHSKKFWRSVSGLEPNYKQCKSWIKRNYYFLSI